ncbi:uncharacterized protein V1516DRAFT_674468 [Lipomyces oligophaga]|uniref:uncharacterized protein n=1 Tax=Lipomyces oligophaga TaxID=45792 RepID=UPI0034CEE248
MHNLMTTRHIEFERSADLESPKLTTHFEHVESIDEHRRLSTDSTTSMHSVRSVQSAHSAHSTMFESSDDAGDDSDEEFLESLAASVTATARSLERESRPAALALSQTIPSVIPQAIPSPLPHYSSYSHLHSANSPRSRSSSRSSSRSPVRSPSLRSQLPPISPLSASFAHHHEHHQRRSSSSDSSSDSGSTISRPVSPSGSTPRLDTEVESVSNRLSVLDVVPSLFTEYYPAEVFRRFPPRPPRSPPAPSAAFVSTVTPTTASVTNSNAMSAIRSRARSRTRSPPPHPSTSVEEGFLAGFGLAHLYYIRPSFTHRALVDWEKNDLRSLCIVPDLHVEWQPYLNDDGKSARLREDGFVLRVLPTRTNVDEIVDCLVNSDLYREHNISPTQRERFVRDTVKLCSANRNSNDGQLELTKQEWRRIIDIYLLLLGCEAQAQADFERALKYRAALRQKQKQPLTTDKSSERSTDQASQTLASIRGRRENLVKRTLVSRAVSTPPSVSSSSSSSSPSSPSITISDAKQIVTIGEQKQIWHDIQILLYSRLGLDWVPTELASN